MQGGKMKRYLTLVAAMALSGCASTAMPNLYSGNYYMAGDKNCQKMSSLSPTRIMCHDKRGNQTGYRDAMTKEDLEIYQIVMFDQAIQNQQLNQNIRELNQSLQNSTQQTLQQAQQYRAPTVQPVTPSGSSGAISYTRSGNVLRGSNGVTYTQAGNFLVGTDGTKCQIVGQNILCH